MYTNTHYGYDIKKNHLNVIVKTLRKGKQFSVFTVTPSRVNVYLYSLPYDYAPVPRTFDFL